MSADARHAHLVDLGSACAHFDLYRGKLSCMAPEVALGPPHTRALGQHHPPPSPGAHAGLLLDVHALDVWALGCCTYMLLTGRPLYASPTDEAFAMVAAGGAAGLIAHYRRFGLAIDPLAEDLVCKMLEPCVQRRVGVEGVLEHAWLREGGDGLKR